jgi:hypothetical protein
MGSAFTTFGNDPIPATTDSVLVPADVSMYAEAIAHKIMHWAADQAERDVLYAAAVAPVLVSSPTAIWLKTSGSGGGSVWKTIWSDTGSVTTGFTNGTDFTVSGGYVRKMNNLVQFTINTLRANTTLAINSSGNIVGDPTMFTLPTGYWPTVTTPGIVRLNQAEAVCEVDTSGVCKILAGTPSYTIAIAETGVVTATFFTP